MITLENLLSKDEINNIVSYIISDAITSSDKKTKYDTLITLAKTYKMYNELFNLIINGAIEILSLKTPKKIYKSLIHSKFATQGKPIQTDTLDLTNTSIFSKYKSILDEIANNISTFSSNFRMNYKFLRQLENVEEIYEMINKNKEDKALDVIYYIFILVFYEIYYSNPF